MPNHLSRRDFLTGMAAAAAACSVAPAHAAHDNATPDVLHEFDYGAVELTGGPLYQQYQRLRAFYLGIGNDRLLKVYRQRAGLPAPGDDMSGWYAAGGFVPGHLLGQYISGLSRFARATNDRACSEKVHDLVAGFAAALGPHDRIYAGPNAENVWPCYVLDKHLAGLIDAATLLGNKQARSLIPRVFQGALPFIPEHGRDRVGKKNPPYDETYVLPENLFSAWALTGERTLYDRANAYLLDRDYFDPLARGQDVLPGRHAYSHVIALSSAGKARLVLGEGKYLRTMQNAWHFLASSQQYASGGWGPNETFIESHKGQLFESLLTTQDHFETPCGSYAAIKLARYLLCATGDARYGDGLERVVYNCLLTVKDPDYDGDSPYYSTYSAAARKTFYPSKWPCCAGTLVQGVSDYVKNIYFRSAHGIAVNLYTPSRLHWIENGTSINLTQETDYPIGQTVTLHIDCATPTHFALSLRIPAWATTNPVLRVNGQPAHVEIQRGFATVRRTWTNNDQVSFDLPLPMRTEVIDDLHPNTQAILRGPLLYVETNPSLTHSPLPGIDALIADRGNPALLRTQTSGLARTLAPLYSVRDEHYTTYFDAC